jgi:hypothetical protein
MVNAASRRSPEWGMYIPLLDSIADATRHGILCEMTTAVGESLICRARNRILSQFLNSNATHLFTIDDDVGLPEQGIRNLVLANKHIIGGVYRLKDPKNAITAVRLKDPRQWGMILNGGLVADANYISSGCMLISKEVVLAMVEAYPELHYTENQTDEPRYALYQPYIYQHGEGGFREYLSEDWAFCQRAKDIGYPVYVHGKVQCAHWGLVRFDFQYPENFMQKLSQHPSMDNTLPMINEELEDRSI